MAQIPGQTKPYFDPYYKAGNEALHNSQEQYNALTQNPGAKLNEIGANYHESPGFQAALERALRASSHAAGAQGMLHSPQHQYNAMQDATDLSNKDYGEYMNKALSGSYMEPVLQDSKT